LDFEVFKNLVFFQVSFPAMVGIWKQSVWL